MAGNYRPSDIKIEGSRHQPVGAHLVPEKVEELCDYVNEHWDLSAIHLAAYVMWRLNWIHPFADGNGRTSRALSYLILCIAWEKSFPALSPYQTRSRAIKRPIMSLWNPRTAPLETVRSKSMSLRNCSRIRWPRSCCQS